MSKADELLRELVDDLELRAKCGVWQGSGMPLDHSIQASSGIYMRARAYLNEKPHEPPPFKECLGCSSPHRCEALQYCPIKDEPPADNGFRMALNIRPLPASPPHAAAEPVGRPIAWITAAREALTYLTHRKSCPLPASNFDKHKPCECGRDRARDAIENIIKRFAATRPAAWMITDKQGFFDCKQDEATALAHYGSHEWATITPLYASPSAQPIAREPTSCQCSHDPTPEEESSRACSKCGKPIIV